MKTFTRWAAAGLGLWLLSVATAAPYKVGVGDVLHVTVQGQESLSGPRAVRDPGIIDLDLLGAIEVAGKTTDEIDAVLTASLGKYLKAPAVTVSIEEYNSQQVYVLGSVGTPGRYVLKGDRRLLDLLSDAGGPLTAGGGTVRLFRPNRDEVETREIALAQLMAGDLSLNVALQSGDILHVPGPGGTEASGVLADSTRVYVVGEVQRPGLFQLEPGATAMAAVLAAGGLTKFARAGGAKVVRNQGKDRQVIRVDLGDVLRKGRKDKDVVLEPGDMVIVPGRLL